MPIPASSQSAWAGWAAAERGVGRPPARRRQGGSGQGLSREDPAARCGCLKSKPRPPCAALVAAESTAGTFGIVRHPPNRGASLNPKGFRLKAQGWRASAYLGLPVVSILTPTGFRPTLRGRSGYPGRNPFRVDGLLTERTQGRRWPPPWLWDAIPLDCKIPQLRPRWLRNPDGGAVCRLIRMIAALRKLDYSDPALREGEACGPARSPDTCRRSPHPLHEFRVAQALEAAVDHFGSNQSSSVRPPRRTAIGRSGRDRVIRTALHQQHGPRAELADRAWRSGARAVRRFEVPRSRQ